MNGCYHYLLLLSIFSSLEKTISINLPNVTIQHICEHDLLFIKCSNINETIQIIRSMYGRTSQRICNYDLTNQINYKTCANIEQSKYQTKLRCQKKSSCQILIDNTIYIDPCGLNISKHFEIHYRCINFDEICFKLIHNCFISKDLKCIEKIQEDYSCQCPTTICEYNYEKQLIGFIENTCSSENFQGIHWPKTIVNKGQHVSCPYPCIGQIFRFCHMNNQWSKPNYTNCQCPIKKFDQLSMHHLAHSYIFQCNFWLINRLLPKDNQCIFEADEHDDNNSATCLLSAFEKMSFTFCLSFSIDFKNLGFEIFLPINNQRKFHLPSIYHEFKSQFGLNQIFINKIDNSYENLPMMFIDIKNSSSIIKSFILVEQSNNLTSIQTANVTVIFNHRSSELRYQCRAYRSTNSSFQINTSDIFFTCQLLCSNGSHVICQCPFYNPFMHYVLQVDTSISEDNFELLMIDNDLKDKCLIDPLNKSIQESINKIDYYLKKFLLFQQKKLLAKKLIAFIDLLIDNEDEWLNRNLYSKWNIIIRFIQQLEFIGLQLLDISNSFISINKYIEFFVNSQEYENKNRSIIISINNKINSTFFIISKLDEYLNINQSSNKLNSHIINLNIKQKNLENIQIIFRHLNPLNNSNQISTCVYLKNIKKNDIQWSTDGCYLLSSNLTHSICSCNHLSTFAVLMNAQNIFEKSITNIHINRLSLISKIGCVISIICLLLTIIILMMRRRLDIDNDLMIVRNILHINMSICLLIAQLLYLFGINQIKYKSGCRTITILLHYFLLATFSWMFVDGIELIIALKHVLKIDRIRILAYSLYAYGFPLLIVILAIGLSTHEHYSNKHCWFSYDNAFIWAFAIPFALLILANICFFIISIYTICKHVKSSNSSKEIKFSLRDITILSILFGLTWLIGLFHLHEQIPIIISYIFTILNSFQGLLIFIFICLLKKQIQHFYIHQILNIYKKSNIEEKSNQHYNTSSSGYSSAHSSDLNKQILSLDHQSSFHTNTEYLSSMPSGLLSTFRYPTSNITLQIKLEQNEQLLKKYKTDLHHLHDDHQYYEIG
ncbi:unnamed protein product [Rotaria sordida]|uniref:Uncharacterized protein n=1 Tax=Rotaria sordida TaxID=392033 RepID=A0A815E4C1_9BILA|nr:unnamed protein product [Rotaria sordida]CAF1578300.1 unnamed protein product [Rotaria sordida]